jgi:very-short-patch-repair endonuclease
MGVDLRKKSTKAEKILWEYLRNRKLAGFKFKRQYSVDAFIIDFYCPKVKLGVELDGEVHFTDEAKEYDENRSGFLSDFGIELIRFNNDEVVNNVEMVLNKIKQKLKNIDN